LRDRCRAHAASPSPPRRLGARAKESAASVPREAALSEDRLARGEAAPPEVDCYFLEPPFFAPPLEPPFDPPDLAPDFEPPLDAPDDFVEPREDDLAAALVVRLVAPAFEAPFAPALEAPLAPDLALDFEAPPEDDFAADREVPADLRAPVLRPADFEPVRLPLFALVFVEEVSESPMALPAASFTLLSAD
jgi:hypothetical protein